MTVSATDPAVRWLLETGDASVRYFTLTDLLDKTARSPAVRAARDAISSSDRVRTLFNARVDGQDMRSLHPYKKWGGAHWRLVSLVELGVPKHQPRALAMLEQVLGWLTSPSHRRSIRAIDGRTRRCASQEGNALAVASRLGMAADDRVLMLAESLVAWQWADGGWNCDKKPAAKHSSFYESLAPLWGLIEFSAATSDPQAARAADRAAEMFMRHDLFRSCTDDAPIDPQWTSLHYPLYWHYDILQALVILSRLRPLKDPRCAPALDLIESKRNPQGLWHAESTYWKRPGSAGSNAEVVQWANKGPHDMLTLNALRVLKAAEGL